jgi:hypothetical protein
MASPEIELAYRNRLLSDNLLKGHFRLLCNMHSNRMIHQLLYVNWLHSYQFASCLKPLSESMVRLKLMTPLAGFKLCSKSLCPKSIFHQSLYSALMCSMIAFIPLCPKSIFHQSLYSALMCSMIAFIPLCPKSIFHQSLYPSRFEFLGAVISPFINPRFVSQMFLITQLLSVIVSPLFLR